ncbi:hypothetical protein ACN24M_00270 [Streptomyces microflavus]
MTSWRFCSSRVPKPSSMNRVPRGAAAGFLGDDVGQAEGEGEGGGEGFAAGEGGGFAFGAGPGVEDSQSQAGLEASASACVLVGCVLEEVALGGHGLEPDVGCVGDLFETGGQDVGLEFHAEGVGGGGGGGDAGQAVGEGVAGLQGFQVGEAGFEGGDQVGEGGDAMIGLLAVGGGLLGSFFGLGQGFGCGLGSAGAGGRLPGGSGFSGGR